MIINPNMKILQLGKFYPIIGGVEKVMYDLLDGLSGHGIECDMLCANVEPMAPMRPISVRENAHVICTQTIMKKFATMLSPQMISTLRRICSHYDIIHIHHPDPMAALSLKLSGYKGKVVLHWHSDILKQEYLLKLYMPLQNWLINRADIIVGTSPVYVAQSPHLRTVQHKCTYLPIGIDALTWNEDKVKQIRRKYYGKKIIFSLGRLVHYKGFEYLVDAARYLPDDYVVLIGGSGELKDELQKRIAENNLQGKVVLLGRVPDEDLSDYFRACSIFCLSSIQKTEAFAIVQIEAMACQRPIVATNIPASGVSWVNAHEESGLNVNPQDSKALSDAIIRIMENDALYEKLSTGAKDRYERLFRKEAMIDKCINIYRDCLKPPHSSL